jgi:hypothetical protein
MVSSGIDFMKNHIQEGEWLCLSSCECHFGLGNVDHVMTACSTHSITFPFITWSLLAHYWLTRASTVGISRRGANILLGSNALGWLMELMTSDEDYSSKSGIGFAFTVGIQLALNVLIPLLKARAIWRLEISEPSWRCWRWRLRQAQPTQKERATDKVDKLTSLWVMVVVRIS